jgi:uridine kinase
MNIIEAYLKYNKQLLIFITGLSGSGKTFQSTKLATDLKIHVIHLRDYYKSTVENKNDNIEYINIPDRSNINNDQPTMLLDTHKKIKLPDGNVVYNQYSTKLLDIVKLNNDINKHIQTGLIVSGFPIPEKLINFKIDYHIHLGITFDKYTEYLLEKKNQLNYNDIQKKYTLVIKPYYKNIIKDLKINKFLNLKNFNSKEKIYDNIWDLIINYISKWLTKNNPNSTIKL